MARDDEPESADLAREREREWQDIVDNFGERAVLDTEDGTPAVDAARATGPDDLGALDEPGPARDQATPDDVFVPPTPPPVPRPPVDRLLAWIGVFGAPAAVLFLIVVGASVPAWVGLVLAVAFIGGFGYLVMRMSDEPRDPWDDGAVL
jgi:hypothetical protein